VDLGERHPITQVARSPPTMPHGLFLLFAASARRTWPRSCVTWPHRVSGPGDHSEVRCPAVVEGVGMCPMSDLTMKKSQREAFLADLHVGVDRGA
jgi:hypothetical protein